MEQLQLLGQCQQFAAAVGAVLRFDIFQCLGEGLISVIDRVGVQKEKRGFSVFLPNADIPPEKRSLAVFQSSASTASMMGPWH